jgi:transposase
MSNRIVSISKKNVKCNQSDATGRRKRTRGYIRAKMKAQKKLAIIPDNSLIVAMDLGKETHSVWMSTMSKEPLGEFTIQNNQAGINKMLARAQRIKDQLNFDKIVIGMEPTGSYWISIAENLQKENHCYVLVHTLSVRREKESREYRHSKSDRLDAESIANLIADRRIMFSKLPSDAIWAGLKAMAKEYLLHEINLVSDGLRLMSFMQRVYPGYVTAFKDVRKYTALSCLLTLKDVLWQKKIDFIAAARCHFPVRFYKSKAAKFYTIIKSSDTCGSSLYRESLSSSIVHTAERYKLSLRQQEETDKKLLEFYQKTGYAEYANTIPHIPPSLHAVVLAMIGDPRNYDSSRCIIKFAGMDIINNESGKYKGKTIISHYGRPSVRYIAYRCGFIMKSNDPIWLQRYNFLIHRRDNPLKKNQALVALGCKYLRILWTLCSQHCYYDAAKAAMHYDRCKNNH